MTEQQKRELSAVLKEKSLKVTKARLAVLAMLQDTDAPLSIENLRKNLTSTCDTVTLYRILQTFTEVGLIRAVNLEHGHAHYELADSDHHHLVCISCGKVAHLEDCEVPTISIVQLSQLGFATIDHHALEFFGVCNACNTNPKNALEC